MAKIPTQEELDKKAARKARRGGRIKWRNIPRNWLHQAVTYMDLGELSFRVILEFFEIVLVLFVMQFLIGDDQVMLALFLSFIVVHTWNWVTNGLFWALMIFTIPSLENPGAERTVSYLTSMKKRMKKSNCISGVAIYGSVSRGKWHNKSDIDIRLLRRPGLKSLICAGWLTMKERMRAFLHKQPMDLFLADDVDFLQKMRSDEIPLLILKDDVRLNDLYPDVDEKDVWLDDIVNNRV